MTRINLIPPEELCDQHLLGEYHEMTRIPQGVVTGRLKVHYADRPAAYVRGKGHMKFFTDKCGFIHRRFDLIVEECKRRGFNVSGRFPNQVDLVNAGAYGTWRPSAADVELSRAWLAAKLPADARWS